MDTKANYTVVGAFVLLVFTIFILLIIWLTSMKNAEALNLYVSYMREDVSGLSVESPVKYNGVTVGYVSSLQLNPHDLQQVIILMKIKATTPITKSTVATLIPEGLTGTEYIGLKAVTKSAPKLTVQPGQLYPVIPSEPSLLLKLSTALQEVTESISLLSHDVRQVFNESNRENISQILKNMQEVTHGVAIHSKEISRSVQHMDVLLENSAKASKEWPKVMQQMHVTMQELNKTMRSMTKAGNYASQVMGEADMSVQRFSQQILPGAQQLLLRLNNLSNALLGVSSDLQMNPAILVRGKTNRPLGPGEK